MSVKTEIKLWLLIAVFVGLLAFGVYSVMRPDRGPIKLVRGDVREIAPKVLIGPYPTEEEILVLKSRGVERLISLMDPSIPVETGLVQSEKATAGKNGLEFANFPMQFISPESAGNIEEALKAAANIRSVSDKKTYVHCYLGRHRVEVFERQFKKGI